MLCVCLVILPSRACHFLLCAVTWQNWGGKTAEQCSWNIHDIKEAPAIISSAYWSSQTVFYLLIPTQSSVHPTGIRQWGRAVIQSSQLCLAHTMRFNYLKLSSFEPYMLLMIKPAHCGTPVWTLAVLLFFTLNYTEVRHHSTEVS